MFFFNAILVHHVWSTADALIAVEFAAKQGTPQSSIQDVYSASVCAFEECVLVALAVCMFTFRFYIWLPLVVVC